MLQCGNDKMQEKHSKDGRRRVQDHALDREKITHMQAKRCSSELVAKQLQLQQW